MTYSRLRKNNSMKESKQSLQERAQYVLLPWNRDRSLEQCSTSLPRECLAMERFSQKEIKGIIHHWHLQCMLQGLDTISEGANTSPMQSCSWILNQMWLEISSIRDWVYLRSGFGPGPWATFGLNLCSGSQCSWYSEHKFSVSAQSLLLRLVVKCASHKVWR